jgi:hypothetical protein
MKPISENEVQKSKVKNYGSNNRSQKTEVQIPSKKSRNTKVKKQK